jgi:hypothetical protein
MRGPGLVGLPDMPGPVELEFELTTEREAVLYLSTAEFLENRPQTCCHRGLIGVDIGVTLQQRTERLGNGALTFIEQGIVRGVQEEGIQVGCQVADQVKDLL